MSLIVNLLTKTVRVSLDGFPHYNMAESLINKEDNSKLAKSVIDNGDNDKR